MTERQRRWFASVQESLERDTGKSLDAWVAIARTCPHDKPRARTQWLREQHGLGVNRAAHVLSVAFPSDDRWDNPEPLRAKLWSDPASAAILESLQTAALKLPDVTVGQRKGFTAFSRKVQMAAARPMKGGHALVGFAVEPDADRTLSPRGRSESWGERLKAQLLLTSPADVNARIEDLLRQAWESS
ncbi:DUF4287 domain-containing protein [Phenylobacterium sp.]|jgi:hypothetical protein|uniref:DUF4287 domain-containing protein n=1 Tax=Phenylobacterium sp. TaxID=1871053 RepID=UPI002F939251